MKQSYFEFNPARDQLLGNLLRFRNEYSDIFPGAWVLSGQSFGNLSEWADKVFDNWGPNSAMEMTCIAHRHWLMMANQQAPTPAAMGPLVRGMILVDMKRLCESKRKRVAKKRGR